MDMEPDEVRSIIKAATDELNPASRRILKFSWNHTGNDGAKWMMILSVRPRTSPDDLSLDNGSSPDPSPPTADGDHLHPVKGKTFPTEVNVQPEVAERWKPLYRKSFSDLSLAERLEYQRLAAAISHQTARWYRVLRLDILDARPLREEAPLIKPVRNACAPALLIQWPPPGAIDATCLPVYPYHSNCQVLSHVHHVGYQHTCSIRLVNRVDVLFAENKALPPQQARIAKPLCPLHGKPASPTSDS